MYGNILEEELKGRVEHEYFARYDCSRIIGKIDFCVQTKQGQPLLWAEAKAGEANPYLSLVQLILTIGRARTYNEHLPPPFLSAFDAQRIAFLPYSSVMEVFARNDFNWLVAPSNYETREFKELYALVKDTLKAKSLVFYYDKDGAALKEFIKANFAAGAHEVCFIQIDKNNFLSVYIKWLSAVRPTIAADWDSFKRDGIIDADFYLADLLSENNLSIKEKLNVLLQTNHYKLNYGVKLGQMLYMDIQFGDSQAAHRAFWAKYSRPPREEYWDYIIERRDLLVPQDVRERKGSFFTPRKWVELSQEYIARTLGENWQDEYVVWDTCAGTGNLLAGLVNKYNIYASTLDKADVDVMRDRIANGAALLEAHVFQFDFLNDDLASDKVPQSLRDILADSEKRKRLVIYMNPPYAEADNRKGQGRRGIGQSMIQGRYSGFMGYARREWFIQFLARIYNEISGCIIANFSTLKVLQSPRFADFRHNFDAKLMSLFLMPAFTFDNVQGQFPIGFHVWDTKIKEQFKQILADVYDKDCEPLASKNVVSYSKGGLINDWIDTYRQDTKFSLGTITGISSDFQHQQLTRIEEPFAKVAADNHHWEITAYNLIPTAVYFSVRYVIPHTWLNHDERFLYPNELWQTDRTFQTDCLAYTLFHGKNRISSRHGVNHWIPFTESEVGAPEKFSSRFMTDFIAGKVSSSDRDLFSSECILHTPQDCSTAIADCNGCNRYADRGNRYDSAESSAVKSTHKDCAALAFSPAAQAVFGAGRELWRYYMAQHGAAADAALYDIKEYFQGRDDRGRMNGASTDEKYARLLSHLRSAMKLLSSQIEPKVYEYGYLK